MSSISWFVVFAAVSAVLLAGCDVSYEPASTLRSAPMAGEDEFEEATFAAGCFWGVEAGFRQLEGVLFTEVGYTGGHAENPTYEQVCTDETGHAESVHLQYDPAKVSYEDLLRAFFEMHNPTTPNRQGFDIGSQYRSAVFYHTPEQRDAAVAYKEELDSAGAYRKPIVTEVEPAGPFWRAEDYHQRYYEKRGRTGSMSK